MAAFLKFSPGWFISGALLLGGSLSRAAATDLTYMATRNGRPIGSYHFSIEHQAGRREVDVTMTIEVKLLFITLYQEEQQRHDVWEDGQLESSVGQSVQGGQKYDLAFARQGGRYVGQVNGAPLELTGTVLTFVPWRPKTTGTVTLLSGKGRTHAFTVDFAGRTSMPLGDGALEVDKYELRGYRDQTLWYDLQGVLQRARYMSHDAVIELRLMRPDPG